VASPWKKLTFGTLQPRCSNSTVGEARLMAARRADALLDQGDTASASMWIRIYRAIKFLQSKRPGAGETCISQLPVLGPNEPLLPCGRPSCDNSMQPVEVFGLRFGLDHEEEVSRQRGCIPLPNTQYDRTRALLLPCPRTSWRNQWLQLRVLLIDAQMLES
jgi:hypothetical protein